MSLIDLFDSLSPIQHPSSDKRFDAIKIPEYPSHRIAVDYDSNPVLLLSTQRPESNKFLKNFKLKYLQMEQNVECKIIENTKNSFENFTVITFTCSDRNMQEYFLRVSETLISTLGVRPKQQELFEAINRFVEIFRALSDAPTKTIFGLWTELFLINNSSNPSVLLNYWHNFPEEKFDFNSGIEKIEVKSNSNFERKHIFSSEQLNPPADSKVLVASIFIRHHNQGQTIQDLIDEISFKVQDNYLINKLHNVIFKTLGSALEQSLKIKFDNSVAKDSLKFYLCEEISKIKEYDIPSEVSEVRYKTDLSLISSVEVDKLNDKANLFNSL